MLRCIIVEDEPLAQQVLEKYISQSGELKLIRKCSNALEAAPVLHRERVDVMFLDINMPVIDGLSFLKSLKNPPAVIITTAYPEHALEGFDLDVTDYLLKPISFERFLKAVNKVIDLHRPQQTAETDNNEEFMFMKVDSKLVKVNYADIIYVEGMKDYLKVFVKDKLLVIHQTMKRFEELLPKTKFIRVHKSYIISLRAVSSITGNTVEIAGKEIPIGANYKDQLLATVYKPNQ